MNTNYETVVSLIELLVKKAGFDLSKNYSEIELQKTKDSISSLMKERSTTTDKKALNSLIENLKVRQANWENNAEIVGRSLVKAYEECKDYSTVKMRIELLGNLALKGTDSISVGSVYSRIRSLDSDYKSLVNKIENTDYRNEEMDSRYKSYLETKLASISDEIEALDKELDSLREVELKDVGIVSRLKEYLDKLKIDRDKIDKVVSSSINSDVAFDVWERLETAKHNTDEKFEHAKDLLTKTESMLDEVRKNRTSINERKKYLETEKARCSTKLTNVNTKLDTNNYENNTERMIDLNNSEMMKLELESLNNKKDVIYVDVGKVKEELIKAWGKERPPIIKKKQEVDLKDSSYKEPEEEIPEEKELEEKINSQAIEIEALKEELREKKKEEVVSLEVKEEQEEVADVKEVIEEKVEDKSSVLDKEEPLDEIDKLIEDAKKFVNTKVEVKKEEVPKEIKQDQIEQEVEHLIKEEKAETAKKNKIELDW